MISVKERNYSIFYKSYECSNIRVMSFIKSKFLITWKLILSSLMAEYDNIKVDLLENFEVHELSFNNLKWSTIVLNNFFLWFFLFEIYFVSCVLENILYENGFVMN